MDIIMTNSEKIYTGLCILFTSFIVLGNLTYQKFILLPMPFYTLELSVGVILYPLVFMITDIITELYTKEKAMFCIRFSIVMNILVAFIITCMDHLRATPWSTIDNETFHAVFGHYGLAFISSLIACYVAQTIDVHLYQRIRQFTKGKYLWLRSNTSSCISLFFDTVIVIGLLTLFGILPVEHMGMLIFNGYIWKLLITLFSTPIFYMCVSSIKYISPPLHPIRPQT
jgi:uncharacterized integral membrane protein (TIGR00697 family)